MTDELDDGTVVYVEMVPRKFALSSLVVVVLDFIRAGFECWTGLFDDVAGVFRAHRAWKENRAAFAESVSRDLESIPITESK